MRTMIAALQISLDGFTQGGDQGEEEWVDSWADGLGLLSGLTSEVDTFVQGGRMYPGYAEFWAAIEKDPKAVLPYSKRLPYAREVEYAQFASKTPHYVLSRTLKSVAWPKTARVVSTIDDLREVKAKEGKTIYVVGGATFVTMLLNEGLLDELRLIVHPLLLGAGGKALFAGVDKRRKLTFVGAEPIKEGRVVLTYRTA